MYKRLYVQHLLFSQFKGNFNFLDRTPKILMYQIPLTLKTLN